MEHGDTTPGADHDREQAEVMESAGVQNAVTVAGPLAILLLPVAWLLTGLSQLVRRLLRVG